MFIIVSLAEFALQVIMDHKTHILLEILELNEDWLRYYVITDYAKILIMLLFENQKEYIIEFNLNLSNWVLLSYIA